MPNSNVSQQALCGTWWRVPEQDTPGHLVYLKDGAALPPARGRYGMTLHEDGSAQLHGPGASDRSESTTTRWRVDANGVLQVDGSRDAVGRQAVLEGGQLKLVR
jgi:hypothetical protein